MYHIQQIVICVRSIKKITRQEQQKRRCGEIVKSSKQIDFIV